MAPMFVNACLPFLLFPPSFCYLLPIAVQVHLGITPEGQDQAQGAAVGAGRGQESHCPPAPHILGPTRLSLLLPAVREVHPKKDSLILTQTLSRGYHQQVAESWGPGCLQLGCLGKWRKPSVTGAPGSAPSLPHGHIP